MIGRIILLLLFFTFSSCALQERKRFHPIVQEVKQFIGETEVKLQVSHFDTGKLLIVHLHADEKTAKNAALHVLEREGGILVSIENNNQRNIQFYKNSRNYMVDPNRIFHKEGIMHSLTLLSQFDSSVLPDVTAFAQTITSVLSSAAPVIAMHNNTDGRYNIMEYTNGTLIDEAADVFINMQNDADDFIITTDPAIFHHFKQNGINAVLQRNPPVKQDGSLSVYYGLQNRSYTNIEVEHGKLKTQVKMLKLLTNYLNRNEKK
ncbi:MAG TPA: hypothetical protein VEX63_10435 [Flavisolibacter sp.]|nr:hypothetical protein [Flavisolibacter sp.]